MARKDIYSMMYDDMDTSPMSINDLLFQIEQVSPPVYQPVFTPEPVYQPTPVYQPEPVYQPPVYQPVYAPEPIYKPEPVYIAPQQTIDGNVNQLPPNLINYLISQTPMQESMMANGSVTPPTVAKQTESRSSTNIIDALTQQILAQSDTSKWKGGVDPETAAKDMAKIMAGIGITDISQFGKVTQTGLSEDVRPDGRGGFVNLKGQPVDPAGVVPLEMDGNIVGYSSPTGTQETYGNKATGQVVPNTYSERQTGNAFGGTFEGKGNTGYRVDFDANGNPIFYTTGASSSDALSTAKPFLQAALIGAGITGLEGLLGGALSGASGATAAELAQANMALGGVGGTAGATELASALATGAPTVATTALTGGSGLITGANAGITADAIAAQLATEGGLLSSGAPSLVGLAPEVAAVAPSVAPAALAPAVVAPSVAPVIAPSIASTAASVAPSVASVAPEIAGMGSGTGITAGYSGLGLNPGTAGLGTSGLGAGITAGSGLTGTGVLTGSALGAGLLGTTGSTALTGTGILSGSTLGTGLLGTGAGTAATVGGIGNTMANVGTGALNTGIGSSLGSTLGSEIGNLLSGGLTLGGGLLQQQTSREAAERAQARIDAETEAAKQAAQFRPVGMTTRFGTSQFQVDPTTGQLVSAGYTLSPEAKAQQDRLVALQNQGLTQAEQAQAQFAPLQTGAQSLFNLGNQYLAQSPQSVAQNYLNQQLALLQPGRELELANLQNRLQQQGRAGLSVAQGGSYGATTPELQALYNARAMQEAQLAAQAQQAGQQQVQFGAGLLGQGAQTMGNYYAGQQAAYAPYTTSLGQVQALEAAGQQPLTMGSTLGQQAAQAGANVGRLGLAGAEQSVALATGQAATTNPYATVLGGLGSSTAFNTAAGNLLGRLFS